MCSSGDIRGREERRGRELRGGREKRREEKTREKKRSEVKREEEIRREERREGIGSLFTITLKHLPNHFLPYIPPH